MSKRLERMGGIAFKIIEDCCECDHYRLVAGGSDKIGDDVCLKAGGCLTDIRFVCGRNIGDIPVKTFPSWCPLPDVKIEEPKISDCICGCLSFRVDTFAGHVGIRCLKCDRVIGAPDRDEAIRLWNKREIKRPSCAKEVELTAYRETLDNILKRLTELERNG